MNKLMLSFGLVIGLIGSVSAQSFTTPDRAFTAQLLDGTIDTSHSVPSEHVYMWQTINADHTESVAMLEQTDMADNTDGNQVTAQFRDGCIQSGGVLLSDQQGTYNGFAGRQLVVSVIYTNGVHVTYTARAWASRTGHTLYVIVVYEQSQNLPAYQNRVNWFLDQAVLPN